MSQSNPSKDPVSRRRLFAGVGAVGALGAAATVLPGLRNTPLAAAPVRLAPAHGGGYTVTEHVKRYYKSALI